MRTYIINYVIIILCAINEVTSTITVPETNRQYASQTASFGMYFVEGREYLARLQSLALYDEYLCDEQNVETNSQKIVIPSDGLPVAILAKKGLCTFETKARIAQQLHPQIKYLLVFNNVPNDDNLITMSAENENGIYVGSLFTEYESGIDLQMQIDVSDDVNADGEKEGIRIYMDSYTNWDDLGWISWIFVLLTCMVSMFLCLSTGYIRANQGNVRVIIVNGTRQYEELLTDEDVDYLSDYEYQDTLNTDKDTDNPASIDTNASSYTPPDTKITIQTTDESVIDVEAKPTEDKKQPSKEQKPEPEFAFDKYSSCSICLEEFESGEKLLKLPCNHYFHPNCIKPWLTERQPTCPLCKANVKHDIDSRRRQSEQHSHDILQDEEESSNCAMNCMRCIGYTLCCCCICCMEELYYDDDDSERRSVYSNASANNVAANTLNRYTRLTLDDDEEQGAISSASPESIHTPLLEGEYEVL